MKPLWRPLFFSGWRGWLFEYVVILILIAPFYALVLTGRWTWWQGGLAALVVCAVLGVVAAVIRMRREG